MAIKSIELDKKFNIVTQNPFSLTNRLLVPNTIIIDNDNFNGRELLLTLCLINYSLHSKKMNNNFSFSVISELGRMPTSYTAAPSVFQNKVEKIINNLLSYEVEINQKKEHLFTDIKLNQLTQSVNVVFSKNVFLTLIKGEKIDVDYSSLLTIPVNTIKLYLTILNTSGNKITIKRNDIYRILNASKNYRPTTISEKFLDPFIQDAAPLFNQLTCTILLIHKRLYAYEFEWN
jgi:hypothetical protein